MLAVNAREQRAPHLLIRLRRGSPVDGSGAHDCRQGGRGELAALEDILECEGAEHGDGAKYDTDDKLGTRTRLARPTERSTRKENCQCRRR